MLKFRKALGAALAVVLATSSFSGFSTTKSVTKASSGNPVTISWYMVVDSAQRGTTRIENAASKYLQSKGINVKLDLQQLTWTDYNTRVTTMISARENFDLLNATVATINSYASSGGFTKLTDSNLKKYAPDAVRTLGTSTINLAKLNGTAYCLPVNKDTADYSGYIYNKDIAKKYGIDVSKIKKMADWAPLFKKLHAKDPSIVCYLSSTFDPIINGKIMFINGSSAMCAGLQLNNTCKKAFDYWEDSNVKSTLKTLRSWYLSGYTLKDTTANVTDLKNQGKVFVYPYSLKPGVEGELSTHGTHWGAVKTTGAYRSIRNFPGGWATGLSATSQNKNIALQVLNTAYKDRYFENLLVFGQKGVDYTTDHTVITVNSKPNYNISSYAWEVGNQFLDYTTSLQPKDLWSQMKKFNSSAVTYDQTGFWFDASNYSSETTAISSVFKQYSTQLLQGTVDVDSTLPQFVSALKSCGMTRVLDGINTQYAKFLKSKKK
jgi:putative aldouronate transport system substrate-binding protein